MQTILVPIDFSPAAEDALRYANKLAVRLPAEVVLVHSTAGETLTPEERAARLTRLAALAERLRYQQLTRQDGRRIGYHFHLAAEALPNCLEVLVAGYRASLVVAGLVLTDCAAATAAGAPLALLPERVSCPVMLVPPGRHELPGRVVVSGDFARLGGAQLAPLAALARTPAARFDLVQFHAPTSTGLAPLKKALLAARAYLPGAEVHLLPEDDALEGLSEFCARQQAHLLVLATADGCLVRRFFNPLYRRTHAYHLRVPALLLPTSTLPTRACCTRCALRQAAATQLAAQPELATF
jgi:nucleotide-binding universal stress UspA family protein